MHGYFLAVGVLNDNISYFHWNSPNSGPILAKVHLKAAGASLSGYRVFVCGCGCVCGGGGGGGVDLFKQGRIQDFSRGGGANRCGGFEEGAKLVCIFW